MIGLLNLGSLVLGLIACAISLYFQILYNYHLVIITDWSALMDTMGAVAFAASLLLIVTIVLNIITMIVYRNRSEVA